jgi:hypothetical protein
MKMKARRAPFTAAVRIALVAMVLAAEPGLQGTRRPVDWPAPSSRPAQRQARETRLEPLLLGAP